METLRAVLAALALTLPFPTDFTDRIMVYESPVQTHSGWLGYACFQGNMTYLPASCPDESMTIVIEPLAHTQPVEDRDAFLKNIIAHETMHLWTGRTGPPEDPFLERQAYRLGCYVSWVPEWCPGWVLR